MTPRYWPYYCEENVWHLCADPSIATAERRVLFISNLRRRVAMWGQRASKDPSQPIAWDYHVVLLVRRQPAAGWEVWDLDGREPGLVPADRWLALSFVHIGLLPPIYTPHFRLIDADDYLRHLRSDRRHMLGEDGRFKQPVPPWPPIQGTPVAGEDNNLERFVAVEEPGFLGECLDLPGLRRWFGLVV
ncbi:MAG: hypothetical protein KC457_23845 [Myxococcales bacterium]|nr:hypothetical protein [Myxococcales bacterium]